MKKPGKVLSPLLGADNDEAHAKIEVRKLLKFLLLVIGISVLLLPGTIAAAETIPIKQVIGTADGNRLLDGDTMTSVPVEGRGSIILDVGRSLPLGKVRVLLEEPDQLLSMGVSSDGVQWQNFSMEYRNGEYLLDLRGMPGQLIRISGNDFTVREVSIEKGRLTDIRILEEGKRILSDTRVEIRFVTDIPSASGVSFGMTPLEMTNVRVNSSVETEHLVLLEGLSPGTKYYYVLRAIDVQGRFDEGKIRQFRTTGTPPIRFSDIKVSNIRSNRAILSWVTNTMSMGKVQYGDSIFYLPRVAFDTVPAASHQVVLTGLQPEKTHYFRIYAQDIYGQYSRSRKGVFKTTEYNIAIGKPVKGTFWTNIEPRYISDTPPLLGRVNDDNIGYYGGMTASGDVRREDQWIIMDLLQPSQLRRTEFLWRRTSYPQKYSISLSLDGKDWELIGDDFNADSGTRSYIGGNPIVTHSIDLGGRIARYIKFFMKAGAPWHRERRQYKGVILHEWKVVPVYD